MSQAERVLRFGIAGIGAGASNLMRGFKRNPRVRMTAAADIRRDALDRFAQEFGARTFLSVEDMCRSDEVDVIWVATPNALHAEHVITAATHKKHVVVSKPMALTLEECASMNRAVEEHGVKLLAGHSQGMAAPVRAMARLILSGDLGRLGMVHTWHYTDWMYRPREPQERDEAAGGGVVFRQSPHQIDIVRMIGGGLVRSVHASTLRLDPKYPGAGAYVATLTFADGTPATLVYSGYGHFNTSELTFGLGRWMGETSRTASVEEEQRLKEKRRYAGGAAVSANAGEGSERSAHAIFGLTLATCEKADLRQSPEGLFIYDDAGRREVRVPPTEVRGDPEVEEMYQAVVHGRPLLHDGRWGMATQEITLAILESAREQREVVLRHQTALTAEDIPLVPLVQAEDR